MNSNHQFMIPARMLNRNRSAQEINKHVSDGFRAENKPKTSKTEETKDFSKSESEMVDVMDTVQHTISTVEKEIANNPYILAAGNRHREHDQCQDSSPQKKTAISKQC